MRTSTALAVVACLAASALGGTRRAGAAFELRDASPSALGSASLDRAAEPLFAGDLGTETALEVSRALLFDAEGLHADRIAARIERGSLAADLAWGAVSSPAAR